MNDGDGDEDNEFKTKVIPCRRLLSFDTSCGNNGEDEYHVFCDFQHKMNLRVPCNKKKIHFFVQIAHEFPKKLEFFPSHLHISCYSSVFRPVSNVYHLHLIIICAMRCIEYLVGYSRYKAIVQKGNSTQERGEVIFGAVG